MTATRGAEAGADPALDPRRAPPGSVVELRLALVCYGGVSLAVYMHGITRELHSLVIASATSDADPAGSPAPKDGGTTAVYRALLDELERRPINGVGTRTRVVIDTVAGTSAGGINGVCLAKAIACDYQQHRLRHVWLDGADIRKLLAPKVAPHAPAFLEALPELRALSPALDEMVEPLIPTPDPAPSAGAKVLGALGRVPVLGGVFRRTGGALSRVPVPGRGKMRAVRRWRPVLQEALRNRKVLVSLVEDPPSSFLSGEYFAQLAFEAITEMTPRRPGEGSRTLMPPDHDLELFVTTTDVAGHTRLLPIHGRLVADKSHRHVFRFTGRRDDPGTLGDVYNRMLAFAARATSSFPGAFAPASVQSFDRDVRAGADRYADPRTADAAREPLDWPRFRSTFFRTYELDRLPAYGRFFVDGGVLNNKPFDHVVAAVRRKRASTQVDRRLLYVEPDPTRSDATDAGDEEDAATEQARVDADPGEPPSLLRTITGAASSIPLEQSILDALLAVREQNEAALRVRRLVEDHMADVTDVVRRHVPSDKAAFLERHVPLETVALESWWDAMQSAIAATDDVEPLYLRLRTDAVVNAFARAACSVCNYPEESNHAFLVRDILRRWAEQQRLFTPGRQSVAQRTDFLDQFDIGFAHRRIRFLIDGVSALYGSDPPDAPSRAQVDRVKERLYRHIATLDAAVRQLSSTTVADEEASRQLNADVAALLDHRALHDLIPRSGEEVERFVTDSADALGSARTALAEALQRGLRSSDGTPRPIKIFVRDVLAEFLGLIAEWPLPPATRLELLSRYIGFPLWDPVTYPVSALANVGERDQIEVVRLSPQETTLLRPPTADPKLKGVNTKHFGGFFKRAWRENDYLWGRLDGVEQVVSLLLSGIDDERLRVSTCCDAFAAVLAEEAADPGSALTGIDDLLAHVQGEIARLRAGVEAPPMS